MVLSSLWRRQSSSRLDDCKSTVSTALSLENKTETTGQPHNSVTRTKHETQCSNREEKTKRQVQDPVTLANNDTRFVNLSHRTISNNLGEILGKGPKFALTQNVTSYTLRSVETGIERAFYGLKWQHVREKTQNTSAQVTAEDSTTPSSSADPANDDTALQDKGGLPRPFFQDSAARQPPTISNDGEKKLEDVKSKIMRLYQGSRKNTDYNYTPSQKQELAILKKDDETIIKKSDKCKNLVLMDKTEYISKAEDIIQNYEIITKNPTMKLEEETKTLMKKTLKDKIPDDYLRKILPQHSRTAEFYGLPKTHKAS